MSDEKQVLELSSVTTGFRRLAFLPNTLLGALVLGMGLAEHEGGLILAGASVALGGVVSFFSSARIKEIFFEGDTVRASSFWRTATFPLSAVAGIEVRPDKPRRAFLHLKEPMAFGDCLAFVPRGTTPRGENPVVEEARAWLQARNVAPPAALRPPAPLEEPGAAQPQQAPAEGGEEEGGRVSYPEDGPVAARVGYGPRGAGDLQLGEGPVEDGGTEPLLRRAPSRGAVRQP